MSYPIQTDDQLILSLFKETNNLRKVGKILGLCTNTIRNRLLKVHPEYINRSKPLKIGDQFANGNIKILELLPRKTKNNGTLETQRYLIYCSICGNNDIALKGNLLNPKRKGCKCLQAKGNGHANWKGCGDITGTLFKQYRHGARHRNLTFNVSIEDIWQLFCDNNGLCKLSGVKIEFDPHTASLDRIDNNLGYELSNLAWIHRDIQFMKQEYNLDYFKYMCNLVNFHSLFPYTIPNIVETKERDHHDNWRGVGNLSGEVIYQLKNGARSRNHIFDISPEYLWNKFLEQGGNCALTGLHIAITYHHTDITTKTASPDRIDNTLGYIEGNVQWVHKDINFMKGSLSNQDYINWCSLVTSHSNCV